jgi:hypothetical protein
MIARFMKPRRILWIPIIVAAYIGFAGAGTLQAQTVAPQEQRAQASKVLSDIADVQSTTATLQSSAQALQSQVEPLLASASHGASIPAGAEATLQSQVELVKTQWEAARTAHQNLASDAGKLDTAQVSGDAGAAATAGGGINYQTLIQEYQAMTQRVDQQMQQIGNQPADSIQMAEMFQLQMAMNELSMFGETITNVIQGIQQIAQSIARNTAGS